MSQNTSDVNDLVGTPEGATHMVTLNVFLQCDSDEEAEDTGLRIRQKVAELPEVMRTE